MTSTTSSSPPREARAGRRAARSGIRETGHHELLDLALVDAMRSMSAGTGVDMDTALAHDDAVGSARASVS